MNNTPCQTPAAEIEQRMRACEHYGICGRVAWFSDWRGFNYCWRHILPDSPRPELDGPLAMENFLVKVRGIRLRWPFVKRGVMA